MGHHINEKGEFQSDKYPDLPPDKIILSFRDPMARLALRTFVIYTSDKELADDIKTRLNSLEKVSHNPIEEG